MQRPLPRPPKIEQPKPVGGAARVERKPRLSGAEVYGEIVQIYLAVSSAISLLVNLARVMQSISVSPILPSEIIKRLLSSGTI